MLYIWPYIVFFSWPLAVPRIVSALAGRLYPSPAVRNFWLSIADGPPDNSFPRLGLLALFTIVSATSVHLNTIVHPFTLADNRHYVFYVFRILRRHPTIKYLVTPLYVISGWAAIRTLGAPLQDAPIPVGAAVADSKLRQRKESTKSTVVTGNDKMNVKQNVTGCSTSFVLVWLATTTLSVISAPLVEPRYFILPWVMWRLHLPDTSAGLKLERRAALWLETIWYVFVNIVTGWIFLHRGFSWPQEPGKVQRFMW